VDTFSERGTQMDQTEYNNLVSKMHTDLRNKYQQARGSAIPPDEQKTVSDLQRVITTLASKFRWKDKG